MTCWKHSLGCFHRAALLWWRPKLAYEYTAWRPPSPEINQPTFKEWGMTPIPCSGKACIISSTVCGVFSSADVVYLSGGVAKRYMSRSSRTELFGLTFVGDEDREPGVGCSQMSLNAETAVVTDCWSSWVLLRLRGDGMLWHLDGLELAPHFRFRYKDLDADGGVRGDVFGGIESGGDAGLMWGEPTSRLGLVDAHGQTKSHSPAMGNKVLIWDQAICATCGDEEQRKAETEHTGSLLWWTITSVARATHVCNACWHDGAKSRRQLGQTLRNAPSNSLFFKLVLLFHLW